MEVKDNGIKTYFNHIRRKRKNYQGTDDPILR